MKKCKRKEDIKKRTEKFSFKKRSERERGWKTENEK